MSMLKPTMSKAAVLALPMLLLTGCVTRVRPALPVCPEPIVLPRSMTAPVTLPTWLPSPAPTSTLSPATASASPKCSRTPRR